MSYYMTKTLLVPQWLMTSRRIASTRAIQYRSQSSLLVSSSTLFLGNNNDNLCYSSRIWSASSSSTTPVSLLLFPSKRLMTSSPAVNNDINEELPSNLNFDYKSSFSPNKQSSSSSSSTVVLQPPNNTETNDDDDDNENNQDDELIEWNDNTNSQQQQHHQQTKFVIPLPDRLHIDIHDKDTGNVNGTIWLNDFIFGHDNIRIDLLKRAVVHVRNAIRGIRVVAHTKTISDIRGSTRKIRQQKGTGKARVGHRKPPHFRGGSKAHGPKNVTNYTTKLNKKTRKLAMRHALAQKLKEQNIYVVNDLFLESHKTKNFVQMVQDWGIIDIKSKTKENKSVANAVLILDHYYENKETSEDNDDTTQEDSPASYRGVPINLWVASGNMHKVTVTNPQFINVYEILKHEKLVMTLSALEFIENRWKEE